MPVATSAGRRTFAALASCYALSGFAALLYQVAWTRQFAAVFGTAETAVAAVLAAYMGGLALGAALARRGAPGLARPLRAYAWMEIAIGTSAALAVPALLWLAQWLLVASFGQQPELPASGHWSTTAYYVSTAFVVLALPTALMGATLPVLARHAVRSDEQLGSRVGLLYAFNTLGAVAGALAASTVLLPALGLRATVWVGAAVNAAVALVAWLLARVDGPPLESAAASPAAPARIAAARPAAWRREAVLPLMSVAGCVSFGYEVLWTRMLGQLLGGSVHAFGVMLASFLTGIAAGGALGGWLARKSARAALSLPLALLASTAGAAFAWYGVAHWLPDVQGFAARAALGFGVLLPLSLAIGTTYPLAVRMLGTGASDAAEASARVYAWNTAGAIAGALFTGFVLLPTLRFEGTLALLAALSATLALAASLAAGGPCGTGLAGACSLAVALCFVCRPAVPEQFLRASALRVPRDGALLFYAVGRSASVVVLDTQGRYLLRSNGLPEASVDRAGAVRRVSGEAWMPGLAVLARPEARAELVIGFGAGNVVADTPESVSTIDVVELEPRVLDANRALHGLRAVDPLTDPRLRLIDNDARGALALSERRYDIILSQPSHPWTAGASHLYTREFLAQARAHLAPGGVLVQWMNTSFIDATLLRSMLATLQAGFGHVRVYRPDGDTLLFLASATELDPELEFAGRGFPAPAGRFRAVGIGGEEDLASALVLDDAGVSALAHGARQISDDDNLLAMARAHERERGMDSRQLGELLAPFDPLTTKGSRLAPGGGRALAWGYLAQRLAALAHVDAAAAARLERVSVAVAGAWQGSDNQSPVVAFTVASLHGATAQDVEQLAAAAHVGGASDATRFALLQLRFGELIGDKPPADLHALEQALAPEPRMVINAARAAAHGDFAGVAAVDSQLAAVAPSRPWAADAVQLRAEWRVRVENPEFRPRLCAEALELLGTWLSVDQNASAYALRGWAASGAGRVDAVLESIAGFARSVQDSDVQLAGSTRQALLGQAQSLQRLLDGLDDSALAARRREVDAQLHAATARLGVSAPAAAASGR